MQKHIHEHFGKIIALFSTMIMAQAISISASAQKNSTASSFPQPQKYHYHDWRRYGVQLCKGR